MSNGSWRLSRGLLYGLLVSLLPAGFSSALFATDHLEQIKQCGVLLWGADAEGGAPYVYPDPRGETVVLIGPSGCGKSTFLRCLNQLEIADAGRITIDGVTLRPQETDAISLA
jgi:ABC-type uncharacterized transport system fused permease/ATPase subunit